MTPLTPAERDALRLRAEKADEVFSGRTVGELILDVRNAHADASAGLLGAALDAILAQCIAEPFEPWPGSLVAAPVASCATKPRHAHRRHWWSCREAATEGSPTA